MTETRRFHTVIVGAGTAGCVLANRLSENPAISVALVEAGPDFGPAESGAWPDSMYFANYVETPYDWNYETSILGQRFDYARGKVMGGSSSINAAGINWGLRQDYDEWERFGNPGWGFEGLLPYFQKVERVENDDPPLRGRDGALVVNRTRVESPFLTDIAAAYAAAGIGPVRDVAGPDAAQGYGFNTRNLRDGVRFHSAAAYLDPVRSRSNLTILDLTEIETLHWQNGRVTGMAAVRDGDHFEIQAERVVLAGGAIGTPVLLQRSGIGPEELLRRVLGTDARIADLPGVGRNLHDHFGTSLVFQAAEGAYERLSRDAGPMVPARTAMAMRLKSSPEMDAFDLDVMASHATRKPARREDETINFGFFLIHLAAEGFVEITSADPASQPRIETGFGLDSDLDALTRGIEWIRERVKDSAVSHWFGAEIAPGADKTGAALRNAVSKSLRLYHHTTGTTKLGPESDPMAVLDPSGKVYGFENLYVGDASVFPTIPRGMINLSVYAAAEKIAAGLVVGG